MGLFTHNTDFGQLEWRLTQDSFLNLYRNESNIDRDIAILKDKNYRTIEFDCNQWKTKSDIDNDFLQLGLPYDNCSNLNALKDCVIELNLPDMSDAVLILKGFDNLIKITDKDYAEGFLDVIAAEARRYLLFGVRLVVLISAKKDLELYTKFGGSILIKRD